MKKKNLAFVIICLALVGISCEKNAGKGGTSTIKGVVITQEWNGDLTIPLGEYPAKQEDVYIIYGGDEIYGDRFDTDYNGWYEFNYLQEGRYRIFVYSKDKYNQHTSEKIHVMKEVNITGKNQTVVVDTMYIIK